MIEKRGGRTEIPSAVGIGLRTPHAEEIAATRPAIGWLEVHSENYLGGGAALQRLEALRRDYPLSLHGVGLSLGSVELPDTEHLRRLKSLIRRTEPFVVSEHLSWSSSGGIHLNDLLPLPYTDESLDIFARNLLIAQDVLGRPLLIENPSRYLGFRHSTIGEPEFLAELVRRTGCGILCDVNNIHVTGRNLGLDAEAYLDALPASAIGEIHLAGHSTVLLRNGHSILIDDHGSRVVPEVWRLFRRALNRFGLVPSLVEWDQEIPKLPVLLNEARKAEAAAAALFAPDRVEPHARVA
jgi:uncharacterized protein